MRTVRALAVLAVMLSSAAEIWPTAYELAPGHRLQLRLTSTDLPTHLAGSIAFDRNDPASAQINLNSPATNTVNAGESYLLLPVER
jgi:predicted acyl esterase